MDYVSSRTLQFCDRTCDYSGLVSTVISEHAYLARYPWIISRFSPRVEEIIVGIAFRQKPAVAGWQRRNS
jgi:hypothetical protein